MITEAEPVIHLNLYSTRSYDIINKLLRNVKHYWGSSQMCHNIDAIQLKIEPDGEVVLKLNSTSYRHRRSTIWKRAEDSEQTARDWLAWVFKCFIDKLYICARAHSYVTEYDFKTTWKRSNAAVLPFTDRDYLPDIKVNLNEVYLIYDLLKNRKGFERRYSKKMIDQIKGIQRDPFQTEMEVTRREEIAKINDEYEAKIHDLNYNSYNTPAYKEMQKMIQAFKDEKNEQIENLRKECDAKLSEINESMNMLVFSA